MLPAIVGDHAVIFSRACTTVSQSYALVKSRVRMTRILRGKRRKPKAKRGKRKVIETNAEGPKVVATYSAALS